MLVAQSQSQSVDFEQSDVTDLAFNCLLYDGHKLFKSFWTPQTQAEICTLLLWDAWQMYSKNWLKILNMFDILWMESYEDKKKYCISPHTVKSVISDCNYHRLSSKLQIGKSCEMHSSLQSISIW